MKPTVCCICGYEFYGFGNNPWPVVDEAAARCCDNCNAREVVPARLARIMEKNRGTEQSKQR